MRHNPCLINTKTESKLVTWEKTSNRESLKFEHNPHSLLTVAITTLNKFAEIQTKSINFAEI
jgi:hypothetical protein